MRVRQVLGTTILLLLVFTAAGFNVVSARASVVSSDWPRTPVEQATRLWGLASDVMARKLYPSPRGSITPLSYYQRDYRRQYLWASLHRRVELSERIGEEGRARFAAEKGWIKLLGSRNRGLRQGPDSVYWDPYDGYVRVLEAKGGTSPVKVFRGFSQNTNQYSIKAAEGVLKSTKATDNAKQAAARLLLAARKHRLATGVVKTEHALGMPGRPQLLINRDWDHADVSQMARKIEQEATRKNPGLQRILRRAHTAHSAAMLRYGLFKGTRVVGRGFAPVILGMEGLQLATAYHGYTSGRLSQRDYYRRSTGAAISVAFVLGGAAAGGVLGLPVGVVGAIPSAITGANVALAVAVPVQWAADHLWNRYYQDFDDQQRLAVNATVERFYGVEAANEVIQRRQ